MSDPVKILLRRDTAANWASENPVLSSGEIGIDLTSGRFKIGDNATAWNSLPWGAATPDASTLTSGTLDTARLGSGTANSSTFLRGDQTWATPAGGAGTDTLAVFTARNNNPPASSFATIDTRNSQAVLDFDDSADESAVFTGNIPEGAVLTSGIVARIKWMATSATSGNVRWRVAFERGTTDLDADSFDTATEATGAANGTSGIETTTEITCTTIDSLVAGDRYRVRVTRVGTDGTEDTMTGDAELVTVELRAA